MESAARTHPVATENEEATEAWSGVLFDRFVSFRELIVTGFAEFSDEALRLHPPKPESRVLDIGCGFGDTTEGWREWSGPRARHLEWTSRNPSSRPRSRRRPEPGSGTSGSWQATSRSWTCRGRSTASSRGWESCSSPIPSRPCATSGRRWRRAASCAPLSGTESSTTSGCTERRKVANRHLEEPEETHEPTCGPGPFSMADADTVSSQLLIAGFDEPGFTRFDRPLKLGDDLDHAVAVNMSPGPAAELIRLAAEEAEKIERPWSARSARSSPTSSARTGPSTPTRRPGSSPQRRPEHPA